MSCASARSSPSGGTISRSAARAASSAGLAAEVAAREDLAFRREDERVIRRGVQLALERALDVAERVAHGAVHLRRAAQRVRVLHLAAVRPAVRLADRASADERAKVR